MFLLSARSASDRLSHKTQLKKSHKTSCADEFCVSGKLDAADLCVRTVTTERYAVFLPRHVKTGGVDQRATAQASLRLMQRGP